MKYVVLFRTALSIREQIELTSTDQTIRDKDLLRMRSCPPGRSSKSTSTARSTTVPIPATSVPVTTSRTPSAALLPVLARTGTAAPARITFGPFDKDGADVVDGNVDGIGHARDGEHSLYN